MKNCHSLFLLSLLMVSLPALAQDMKPKVKPNPLLSKPIPEGLKKVLLDDKTDEHGFYHAINAYLVTPEKPQDIESCIFIEPKSDEILFLRKYRHYYDKGNEEEVVHLTIGTFDKFKNNGSIYQSFSSQLYEFDIKFK